MIFVFILFVVLADLFVVLYFLLKNHVVREVGSIHGSLKKITDGDLDEKADAEGSLEFYELSSGVNATVSFDKQELRLEPGDSLFLYTDGITQAKAPDGEPYGEERLLRSCSRIT